MKVAATASLSPLAASDLRVFILDRREYAGLQSARRLLTAFQDAVVLLRRHPEMGAIRDDLTARPVRFWPVERYWIVYTVRPFYVVRVLGAQRDVVALLD